ncbi:MAG: DUF1294 domain-containing protein [Altererythrobacter sp.]
MAMVLFYFALLGLLTINLVTFGAFWADKLFAQSREWRISEATLLQLALFGGTPAAYAARAFFRHKSRKRSFSNALHTILAAQIAVCALIGGLIYHFL